MKKLPKKPKKKKKNVQTPSPAYVSVVSLFAKTQGSFKLKWCELQTHHVIQNIIGAQVSQSSCNQTNIDDQNHLKFSSLKCKHVTIDVLNIKWKIKWIKGVKCKVLLRYRLFPIAFRSSMCWQQFTVPLTNSEWLKGQVSMNSPVDTSLNSYVWSVSRTLERPSQVSNLWAITIPAKSNCHLFL